jgi:signal transduction histidine kinase
VSGVSDEVPDSLPRWTVLWVVGPLVLLVVALGGTFGAAHNQPGARQLDALAIVLVAAGPVALLGARREPRGVLTVVTIVTAVYVALGYPYGPVFAAFAIAVVVATALGHRVWAWAAVGVALFLANVLRTDLRGEGWSWGWALGTLAWAGVIVAVGELIRVRRARVAEARRAWAEAARRRAGEERLQIARELHDVVAHHMSLINVQASVALELREQDPEQVQSSLVAIKGASKEALTELRSLIRVLRAEGADAPREPVTSLSALDDLAERTRQTGLTVEVETSGALDRVPSAAGAAAIRIVQEAVTNVVRHSGASRVRIAVDVGETAVDVLVEDDGRGVGGDPGAVGGTGIQGMEERSRALGGTVEVRPRPGRGTRVRAHLPIGGAP